MLALLATLGAKVLPLLTGINPAAILGGIGGAVGAFASNVKTYWKAWLIGLLIVLQVGTGYGFYHEHGKYVNEVSAHKADNAKFVAAQKAADLNAQNIKKQLQTESKAASHEADTNYSSLLSKYNASLLRYATAAKGGVQGPSDSQLPTTGGIDGPGTDADLPATLTITGVDAKVCAVNTARLQASHDWALQQLEAAKATNK